MFGFGPRKGRRRTPFQIKLNDALHHLLPALRAVTKIVLVLGLAAFALWGLHHSQAEAELRPKNHEIPQFELVNAPGALQDMVLADLQPLAHVSWNDPHLCKHAYERLARNGWVRSVRRVAKGRPDQVVVDCDYRIPIALARVQEYYYLVDEYGVRLPGTYDYDPGWLLIEGLEHEAAQPGQVWPGADAAAAIRLGNLLRVQPFGRQVSALLMDNYGGRIDPYASHIELETGKNGGRIRWGSAPGDELEENTTAQKLHILSENFRRYGRIDAHHPRIDISVFPDRFLIPS